MQDGFDYSLGSISCNNIEIGAVTVSSSSASGAAVALYVTLLLTRVRSWHALRK